MLLLPLLVQLPATNLVMQNNLEIKLIDSQSQSRWQTTAMILAVASGFCVALFANTWLFSAHSIAKPAPGQFSLVLNRGDRSAATVKMAAYLHMGTDMLVSGRAIQGGAAFDSMSGREVITAKNQRLPLYIWPKSYILDDAHIYPWSIRPGYIDIVTSFNTKTPTIARNNDFDYSNVNTRLGGNGLGLSEANEVSHSAAGGNIKARGTTNSEGLLRFLGGQKTSTSIGKLELYGGESIEEVSKVVSTIKPSISKAGQIDVYSSALPRFVATLDNSTGSWQYQNYLDSGGQSSGQESDYCLKNAETIIHTPLADSVSTPIWSRFVNDSLDKLSINSSRIRLCITVDNL